MNLIPNIYEWNSYNNVAFTDPISPEKPQVWKNTCLALHDILPLLNPLL